MHAYKPVPLSQDGGAHFIDSENRGGPSPMDRTEYTITELAQEFGLTLRALRFYEIRGLLSPTRMGRKRIFSRADRDRLAAILKGKQLGFTLHEISDMIDAQAGRATQHGLKMTSEKCLEQIAHFERQIREATEALTELRRIQLRLGVRTTHKPDAATDGETSR